MLDRQQIERGINILPFHELPMSNNPLALTMIGRAPLQLVSFELHVHHPDGQMTLTPDRPDSLGIGIVNSQHSSVG